MLSSRFLTKSAISLVQFFLPLYLLAAGNMGKDLEYVYLGTSGGNRQYQVTVRYFWHCWDYVNGTASSAPPASLTLKAVSTGCGINTTFTLNSDNSGSCPDQSGCTVSPLCAAQTAQGACGWSTGGNPPYQGIKVYRYSAIISLPTGCSSVYLGIDECCRAGNVSNIVNPTSSQGAILAVVNTAVQNNSVHYLNMPDPFVCAGSQINMNYGGTDSDDDSLVYSLITPLQGTTPPYTNVTFNAAWNINSPVRTAGVFGFNGQNGQMDFVPAVTENDVITVKVDEYRNGILVGSTMRDVVLIVTNCLTSSPVIHSMTSVNTSSISPTSVSVCPNTEATIRIFYHDPTNKNIISATVTASPEIQGSLIVSDSMVGVAPNDSAYKIIRWTPALSDTGSYWFSLTVRNDDCPVNGTSTQLYQIRVMQKVTVSPHTALYCGSPIRLTASGGTNFLWTPVIGLTNSNTLTPSAAPSINTRYTFSSDCGIDTAWVEVRNIFNMDAGVGGQICRNGQQQLHATHDNVYPNYSIRWYPSSGLIDPVTGLPSDSIFNPIASPYNTTTYTAVVTAPNGCSRQDTVTVRISGVAPSVSVTASPAVVCPGEPVTLTAVTSPAYCGTPTSICSGQEMVVTLSNNPVTQGGAATQYPSPYGNYYVSARHQYLIRASELAALIGSSNGAQIKRMAMNIAVVNSSPVLQNFTIKMGCTLEDSLTAYQGNLITVFNPKNVTPIAGWNTHVFDQYFDWDGLSNVVIDICFTNPSGNSFNNKMEVNTTTYRSQLFTWSNIQSMCGISGSQPTAPLYATYFERPTIRLNACLFDLSNANFTWTPNTGVNAPSPLDNDTTTARPVIPTTYTARVVETSGCTVSGFASVAVDTSLRFSVSPDTMVCRGMPVQLHAVAQGIPVAPAFTYTWTASAGTAPPSGTGAVFADPIVTPSQPTTYYCTLTGGLCTLVDSVVVMYAPNIPASIVLDSINCFNAANGKLRVVVSGGVLPYSYTWTPVPSATDSLVNVAPGNYSVTVSDSHSCSGTAAIQVTQPPQLTLSIAQTASISCFGGNNASLNANAGGGTPGYSYSWSNSSISSNQNVNLTAGSYSVTVRDSKFCTATAFATVTQPGLISVAIDNIDSVLCYNTPTGSAFASTTGGVGGYVYSWSAGSSTTAVNTALPVGTGFVVVADANQCRDTATFIIEQPTPVQADANAIPANCSSSNDGSASVVAWGGTGTYSYVWDGVPGTNAASNLSIGNHYVTVSDINNCTAVDSVFIDTLYRLRVYMMSAPASCYGSADGTAEVITTNGSPNFQYSWSVPGSSGSSINTTAGTVSVTVTDGNACTATGSAIISQPPEVLISTGSLSPSCFGKSDGAVWVGATGGNGNYVYGWSSLANTDTVKNLIAGTYQVTVLDGSLCSATAEVVLVGPSPVAAIFNQTGITCFGADNGALSVLASGGEPPYSYLWQDLQNAAVRTNLHPGTYQVTVSDANNCTAVLQTSLTEPLPIHFSSTVVDSVRCPYIADGQIAVGITGGTPSYSYSKDGFSYQNDSVFPSLGRGDYTIYVRDANGCEADTSLQVGEAPGLAFVILPIDSTINLGGEIHLYVLTNNYPYSWMNSFSWSPAEGLSCSDCLDPVFTGYTSNTYSLSINYGHNCVATDTVSIYVDDGITLYIPNAFSPDGDGKNETLQIYGKGITEVAFRIFDRWGEKLFETTKAWEGWDGTFRGEKMPPGIYMYEATVYYLTGKKNYKFGSITLIR